MEIGTRAQIFENPRHGYTRSLLSAVPIADPAQRQSQGDLQFRPIPSPVFPLDYVPPKAVYDEVEPGHLVMRNEAGEGLNWSAAS